MNSIALISDHASPLVCNGSVDCGGQNVYVANVALGLGARGVRVDVFTRRDSPAQPTVVEWRPNVRVVHVTAGPARFIEKEALLPFMDDFAANVADFLQHNPRPVDLCHANFFMSGRVALQLQRDLGIPYAITFHALGKVRRLWQKAADRFPCDREEIESDVARHADRVIAECPQDEEDLRTLYDIGHDRIDVVPCGFEPAELRRIQDARAITGWPAGEFSILHLGRMVPRKGVDNIIRAMQVLRRVHGLSARLYIAGGNTAKPDPVATPHLGELMLLAKQVGVADRVTFLGQCPRDRLSRYYSAADVFVTTPWYEPFGITPLEAMACATPVIGSSVGGIKHTVLDGRTGYLVPANDPVMLAERIVRLERDPSLARRMGEAGLRHVRRQFTWNRVVDDLMRCYRRIAGSRRPMRVPMVIDA
jgi:D-inositol-3-phosphate glycosyltransferase